MNIEKLKLNVMKVTKQNAIELATNIVANATNFFKANKNIGALTTLNRKSNLKAQIQWLVAYCDKKSINAQQFAQF